MSNKKVLKELFKQSWIPALLAFGYAIWDYHSTGKGEFKLSAFLKSFGTAFFLIMWFMGQFLRVKKQLDDRNQNYKIDQILQILIEQGLMKAKTETASGTKDSTGNVESKLNNMKSQLLGFIQDPSKLQELDRLVVEYAGLAEASAEKNFNEIKEIDLDTSNITIDSVKDLHKTILPKGYALAGRLRLSQVTVNQSGSTTAIIPDHEHTSESIFNPSKPNEIIIPLETLLRNWNNQYPELAQSSDETRLKEIASFHHRFTKIHPFMDGNGRLARAISAKQINDLLNIKIHPRDLESDKAYIEALRNADKGQINPLTLYLRQSISHKTVSPSVM